MTRSGANNRREQSGIRVAALDDSASIENAMALYDVLQHVWRRSSWWSASSWIWKGKSRRLKFKKVVCRTTLGTKHPNAAQKMGVRKRELPRYDEHHHYA